MNVIDFKSKLVHNMTVHEISHESIFQTRVFIRIKILNYDFGSHKYTNTKSYDDNKVPNVLHLLYIPEFCVNVHEISQ